MDSLTAAEAALLARHRRQAVSQTARPPASQGQKQPTLGAVFSRQRQSGSQVQVTEQSLPKDSASQMQVAEFPVPQTGQPPSRSIHVHTQQAARQRQARVRTRRQQGGAGSRTDLTVQQKADLCTDIEAAFKRDGISKRAAWKRFAADWKLHTRTVQRIFAAREIWQQNLRGLTEKGRGRAGRLTGKRNGRPAKRSKARQVRRHLPGKRGYLGTTDHLRAERLATRQWGLNEEGLGHNINQSALFFAFQTLVADAVAGLESRQEAGEILSTADSQKLKFAQGRLAAWQKSGRNLERQTEAHGPDRLAPASDQQDDQVQRRGRTAQARSSLAQLRQGSPPDQPG